jgi:nicotinate-nucleotide pyrophosphorylase
VNKKEAFDIAWEVSGLANLAAIGEVALTECDSIIIGLVKSSPKVLDELKDMNLSKEVIELFDVVGIKLDEK